MMKRIALIAFLLLIPSVVCAGDFSNGTYHSNLGYSVKVPADWTRVDASTVDALKDSLPENIDPDSTARFDVIFFPQHIEADLSLEADRKRIEEKPSDPEPSAADQLKKVKKPEFSSNISIMVVDYAISNVSQDALKAYGDAMAKSVADNMSFAKDFKISALNVEPFDRGDAFFYQYEFQANKRNITVQQAVMNHKQNVYIVTCTCESEEFSRIKNVCRSTINSISF